jgi:hypothetical protein
MKTTTTKIGIASPELSQLIPTGMVVCSIAFTILAQYEWLMKGSLSFYTAFGWILACLLGVMWQSLDDYSEPKVLLSRLTGYAAIILLLKLFLVINLTTIAFPSLVIWRWVDIILTARGLKG